MSEAIPATLRADAAAMAGDGDSLVPALLEELGEVLAERDPGARSRVQVAVEARRLVARFAAFAATGARAEPVFRRFFRSAHATSLAASDRVRAVADATREWSDPAVWERLSGWCESEWVLENTVPTPRRPPRARSADPRAGSELRVLDASAILGSEGEWTSRVLVLRNLRGLAEALARRPALRRTRKLAIQPEGLTDDEVAPLLDSPLLGRLVHLDLGRQALTEATLVRLGDSPHLGALRWVDAPGLEFRPTTLADENGPYGGVPTPANERLVRRVGPKPWLVRWEDVPPHLDELEAEAFRRQGSRGMPNASSHR